MAWYWWAVIVVVILLVCVGGGFLFARKYQDGTEDAYQNVDEEQ